MQAHKPCRRFFFVSVDRYSPRAAAVTLAAVLLCHTTLVRAEPGAATAEATRQQDLDAARQCFEANLDAIRRHDRDAYLSTYWQSESLSRTGWGGIARGYAEHARNTDGTSWPDVFDAQDMQLVWVQPGVVYGCYRYRVVYGTSESTGISERLFLKTAAGWRIAMTSAFGAPEGTPPPPLALVDATLVFPDQGTSLPHGNIVVRAGHIQCAGGADTCPVPEGVTPIDMRGQWILPGLIDTDVHLSQSGWVDTHPEWIDVRTQFPVETVQATLQRDAATRLQAWLSCGVTAVLDRGGYPWTLDLRASPTTTRPLLAAVGPVLGVDEPETGMQVVRQHVTVRTEDDVQHALRWLRGQRSDAVVFRCDPRRDVDEQAGLMRQIGRLARQDSLVFLVDGGTLAASQAALQAGARLVSGVWDRELDAAFVRRAHESRLFYASGLAALTNEIALLDAVLDQQAVRLDDPFGVVDSTLAAHLQRTAQLPLGHETLEALRERRSALQTRRDMLQRNLLRAHADGLRLVVASGAGAPGSVAGMATLQELEAMQAAGLPALAVLRAATSNAAALVPAFHDRGVLRAEAVADLVVVAADPTADVGNLRRQTAVVRGGELRWRQPR